MGDGGDEGALLRVATRRRPECLEVVAVGELDLESASVLVREAVDAFDQCPLDVHLVLDGVTFIDSSGMLALLDVRDAVRTGGRRLRLVAPSPAVCLVLDLAGLAGQFEVDGPIG